MSDGYERYDSGLKARLYDDSFEYEARYANESNEQVQVNVDKLYASLREIYDPEIPVNILDLGLVYDMSISPENDVSVLMTLTAPACPAAEILPKEVAEAVGSISGIRKVGVEITWEVPWNMDMMSEEARLELGLL